MANRLLERLEDGPPLVADGGIGVLVSSAAPRSGSLKRRTCARQRPLSSFMSASSRPART